jgi:hypothetical protein
VSDLFLSTCTFSAFCSSGRNLFVYLNELLFLLDCNSKRFQIQDLSCSRELTFFVSWMSYCWNSPFHIGQYFEQCRCPPTSLLNFFTDSHSMFLTLNQLLICRCSVCVFFVKTILMGGRFFQLALQVPTYFDDFFVFEASTYHL